MLDMIQQRIFLSALTSIPSCIIKPENETVGPSDVPFMEKIESFFHGSV